MASKAKKVDIEKTIAEYIEENKPKGVKLHLGCGSDKQEGFLGVDKLDIPGVDIIQDPEQYPWVFPDECAELVIAPNLVERINPAGNGFIKFMDEVWRVLIPGGKFMIATPYAGSPLWWRDPTHCNACTEMTWAYFDPLDIATDGLAYKKYKPKPWKIIFSTWTEIGNLEVALEKRREDPSYYE